jgi:general secretion pathway protein D
MADEINNAVLVYGTRGEFEKIEMTLRRLDIPPTQVLIEASIIEVTLTDDLKYGLQWIFTDKARGGLTGTGVLSTAAGAAFGATPAGFSYTLRNTLGDVRAVISALADKSLVKVISSPSLMVLDNHTATIAVGNQQPIKVGDTITTGGVISSNIQYKDTGVSLAVTPSVNAGNMVTMQINQSVTDVGQVDAATLQRSFLQRQFASKVAVRSGETLVLGGLIRDNTTNGKSGLPGLQDIPLFGNLFGTNASSTNRTELLVVITPRVVRTEQDMRQLGQELKDRMKTLYPSTPQSGNPVLSQ